MSAHTLDRLRLLALGGMALASLTGLVGCGGGGETDPAEPPPGGGSENGGAGVPGAGTSGTPVGSTERLVALDAVAAATAALSGTGMRFDSAALVRQLQAMPVFSRVGFSDSMHNVWASFTDGRALVVPNNLEPPPPAGAAAAATRPLQAVRQRALGLAGEDLPALLCEQQYRQIDTFGAITVLHGAEAEHLCDVVVGPDTLPDLRRLAIGRGFVQTPQAALLGPDRGYDNGVEGLRSVSGDGVFFVNGTAAQAVANNGALRAAIVTATPADAEAEARYDGELRSSTLVYAVAPVGAGDRWVWRPRLAITRDFASQNRWSFPTRCIGILNLTGGAGVADDWLPALGDAGLRNVFYWRAPVSVTRVIAFADDLMQLLLASNRLLGARRYGVTWPPRLRTHGVGETIQFLGDAGLAADPGGVRQSEWLPELQPGGYVNTLLPTIDVATIREGPREIELVGQFGAPRLADDLPGQPEVRFGNTFGGFDEGRRLLDERTLQLLREAADPPLQGVPLPDRGWKGDVITLDAGNIGPGGGYLQVRNGGRVSNAVPITYWKIPVHIVHEVDGALRTDCAIELHLRADVSAHRTQPHQRPGDVRRIAALASMFESNARYSASGELSETDAGVTTTLTWSGGSSAGNTVPGQHEIGCAGLMDQEQRRASVAITGGAASCLQREVKRRGTELLSDVTLPLPVSASAVPRPEAALEFVFDERWVLLAGGQSEITDTTFVLGRERVRTTVVRWDVVIPECAPRDDLGGV
jgi:hypothetical protein